jgi:dihydroflavonol-4-reductase
MEHSLSGFRILVTGASGSLGSQIIFEMANRGLRPVAHVRKSSNTAFIDSLGLEKRYADLRNHEELDQVVRDIDIVIHSAAWVSFRQDRLTQFTSINTFGAVDMFKAAQKAGVRRFVHVSSVAAVGAMPRSRNGASMQPTLITENFKFNLADLRIPYILSKRAAEEELTRLAFEGGPELVIVNPSIIVAPSSTGDDRAKSMRLFGKRILPDVPSRVNLVDIRDVAPAIIAAAVDGRPGERYILGGENISAHDLAIQAANILGVNPALIRMPRTFLNLAARLSAGSSRFRSNRKIRFYPDLVRLLDFDWAFSSAKARAELGFTTRPLAATLRELLTNQFTGTYLRP